MASIQSKLFVSLLFSLFLLSHLTDADDVVYCNKKAKYDVKVSGIEISPYPISRGKNTTFSIAASTDKAISGGKLVIEVSYIFFQVYSETHDLCKKTSCPVAAGAFEVSHSQLLPGFTPPGSYTLKMKMLDGKNHEMTCFTFDFSIWFGDSKGVADN